MTSAARSFRGCLRADSCFLNITPFPGQCHPLMAHFNLGRVTLWGSVCSQKSLPGYWCLSGCPAVQFLPLPSSASSTFLSQVLIPKKHPTSQTLSQPFWNMPQWDCPGKGVNLRKRLSALRQPLKELAAEDMCWPHSRVGYKSFLMEDLSGSGSHRSVHHFLAHHTDLSELFFLVVILP